MKMVRNKATVGYLETRKKVTNWGLRFSDFKTKNTLRWLTLKVKEKQNKKLQRRYSENNKQEAKSKMFRI